MIQLVFESTGKLAPGWEYGQERLVFRLALPQVSQSRLLHGRMDEAGESVTDAAALGMVDLEYDGDVAHQVRVILELPDDVWDVLADRADALLERASL